MVKQISIAYSGYKSQDHAATFWGEKGAFGGWTPRVFALPNQLFKGKQKWLNHSYLKKTKITL